jgi:tRNA pseudouridine38-40 synthase
MNNKIIDGSKINTKIELHETMKTLFEFPDYYGMNLDAMFDILSTEKKKMVITIKNWNSLKNQLSTYAEDWLYTLKEVEAINDEIVIEMKNEMIEDQTIKNFRLDIQYDGGNYKGWQRLGDDNKTIQWRIEQVLSRMFEKEIKILGCGRTDAGVHAINQVANFHVASSFDQEEVRAYLNRYLPDDIAITGVSNESQNFHSRLSSTQKTYLYRIWQGDWSNPFERKYSMHVRRHLDLNQMKRAAGLFFGTHDFTAFSNSKSKKKSKVRTVFSIDIDETDKMLEIRITGDGFLHHMVRKMMGLLIEVGLDAVQPDQVLSILASKDRSRVKSLAEPQGLFLEKVVY